MFAPGTDFILLIKVVYVHLWRIFGPASRRARAKSCFKNRFQAASERRVDDLKRFERLFNRTPRPESGLDCLTCAMFARLWAPGVSARVPSPVFEIPSGHIIVYQKHHALLMFEPGTDYISII